MNFKDLKHYGFIRPVRKSGPRSQVPKSFLEYVVQYESAKNPHLSVRGTDLVAVMTVLRSKPPTHCWKGEFVIKEMRGYGMGEGKVKAVLSCLSKSGWIRYLKGMKGGKPVGSVIEVMYQQLPEHEARQDRIIRFYDGGNTRIFQKSDEGWIQVPDEDYPATFVSHPEKVSTSASDTDAEPLVWVPSEWMPSGRVSSERGPSERGAPPQYNKDIIGEDNLENHPNPLSEKGGQGFASPGRESLAEPDSFTSPAMTTIADDDLSSPGGTNTGFDSVSKLIDLGLRSLNSPAELLRYEEFVVDVLLPQLDSEPAPPTKWETEKGMAWLKSALVARVILALFSDRRWLQDVARAFYKRARNLSTADLKTILLGFDWSRHKSESVTSLFSSMSGKVNAEGWERFIQKSKTRVRGRAEGLEAMIEGLGLEGDAQSAYQSWIAYDSRGPVPNVGEGAADEQKFLWLYKIGLGEKLAFPPWANDPRRPEFEHNRAAWCGDMTNLAAKSAKHLAVVMAYKAAAQQVWGVDPGEVRKVHDEWMDRLHRSARIYGLKVEKKFTAFFDFDYSKVPASPSGGVSRPLEAYLESTRADGSRRFQQGVAPSPPVVDFSGHPSEPGHQPAGRNVNLGSSDQLSFPELKTPSGPGVSAPFVPNGPHCQMPGQTHEASFSPHQQRTNHEIVDLLLSKLCPNTPKSSGPTAP